MANYLGWEITNKGRELLARAMNNETKINVTKFKIGAGYNTGNDRELTDLLDKRNEFPVNSYERKENGNVEFTFIVSNKTGSGTSAITNSYKISEMGIYARDDFGTEILYAYNKGTDGDYIPVFNGKNAIDILEKCIIVIDQSANLNVTIDSSNTYITRDSAERNYVKKTDFAEENKAGIISLSAVKGLIPNATEYANGTVNLRQIKDIIDTKVPNATHDTVGKVMLGTTANTVLEGKRLAEIIGMEFGGNIQDVGTKVAGKFYYDKTLKHYYECIVNNALTYNDGSKFRAISNKPISDRLEKLVGITETVEVQNSVFTIVRFWRYGKRAFLFVFFDHKNSREVNWMTEGIPLTNYPANFVPDTPFLGTEHIIISNNNLNKNIARLVLRNDKITIHGVEGMTHYEIKGIISYITK